MPIETFSDDCPGCQPVVLDPTTGDVLPNDHPVMAATLEAWKYTTWEERKSFHAVMCLNSREPADVQAVERMMDRVQEMVEKSTNRTH